MLKKNKVQRFTIKYLKLTYLDQELLEFVSRNSAINQVRLLAVLIQIIYIQVKFIMC